SEHFITNGSSGYPFYRIDKNNFGYRHIIDNVTKITIGPHVKQLHADIFRHAGIEEITIPANVEYICGIDKNYNVLHGNSGDLAESPAFTSCTKLKIINVEKNYEDLHIGAPWIDLAELSGGRSITVKWLDREETYTKN
ncbi:MAG: hypothetical protein K6D97_03880, partial [Clostridia bacterium]|nr:hypothetical protein [Clostridia bacterium]